jgi:hypothetical protein
MRAPVKVEKISIETGEVLGWFWCHPVDGPTEHYTDGQKRAYRALALRLREHGVVRLSRPLRAALNLPSDWEPVQPIPMRKRHTLIALRNALASAPNIEAAKTWERRHGEPAFGRQFGENHVPMNPHRARHPQEFERGLLDAPSQKVAVTGRKND